MRERIVNLVVFVAIVAGFSVAAVNMAAEEKVQAKKATAIVEKVPADEKPSEPALTNEQQLELKNALQAVQLAELQARPVLAEYERAKAVLQALVKTRTPDGYEINNDFKLVKKAEPKPAEKQADK